MVEAVGNTVYTNVFKIKSRRIILHGMRAYDGNFVRRVSRRSMNSSTVCGEYYRVSAVTVCGSCCVDESCS